MQGRSLNNKAFRWLNGLMGIAGLCMLCVLPNLHKPNPLEEIAKNLIFMLCLGMFTMWPAVFGTRLLFKRFLKLENVNPDLNNISTEAALGVIGGLLGMVVGLVLLLLVSIKVSHWLIGILF